MSKRKGVSAEEKLDKLEGFFIKTVQPWSVAELEKEVPKAVNEIKSMLIKDLLKQLSADNRVETDKIGLANYYWCFPSQAAASRKRKIEVLDKDIEEGNAKKRKLEEEIEKEAENKQDSEERKEMIRKRQSLLTEKDKLDKQLKEYAERDPELIKKIQADVDVAKEGAERWTDSIFELKKYCKNKFNMDPKAFNQFCDIDDEFDYVE